MMKEIRAIKIQRIIIKIMRIMKRMSIMRMMMEIMRRMEILKIIKTTNLIMRIKMKWKVELKEMNFIHLKELYKIKFIFF